LVDAGRVNAVSHAFTCDASGGYGWRYDPPIRNGYQAHRRRDYEQPVLTSLRAGDPTAQVPRAAGGPW